MRFSRSTRRINSFGAPIQATGTTPNEDGSASDSDARFRAGATRASAPATNIATGPRQRVGTFREGATKTTFQLRKLTPAEVARVAANAQVKGVSLDASKDVYQVGDQKTYVQGANAQDAANQVAEQLANGTVDPARVESGFLSRRILGIPVWGWGLGAVGAVGTVAVVMKRRRG